MASTLSLTAQVPVTNGLVTYYPFNGNVTDASGNGYNGTLVGGDCIFSYDLFGNSSNALYLNTISPPTNDVGDLGCTYVSAPRNPAMDFSQDFTLSLWGNIPNGLPGYYPLNYIGNGDDDPYGFVNLRVSANDQGGQDYLQFVCNHALGDIHAFVQPSRNTWWQAVVVRSGTSVSLYRNGVLLTNGLMTATTTNFPTVWLGRYACPVDNFQCSSAYAVSGGMSDVRMYNRALSIAEVRQLYQGPPQILAQPQDQVGYWGFGSSLSVTAEGSQPLGYQWFIDGLPIDWATNATLQFANLDLSDAGTYEVQITNFYGSVLSEPATLLVNPAGVSLGFTPTLTITGAVGKSFGIQYSTNLALSNGWATVSSLTLTQPAQLWFDTNANISSPAHPQRFYRVVATP